MATDKILGIDELAPMRRDSAGMATYELIADAIGYHAGRTGEPLDANAWGEQAIAWFLTPRGGETYARMTGEPPEPQRGIWPPSRIGAFGWGLVVGLAIAFVILVAVTFGVV